MKYFQHKITIASLLVTTLFLLNCTRDKFQACFSSQTIDFVYYGDGKEDILSQKINTIDLLIYDSELNLLETYHTNIIEPKYPVITADLPNGNYTCVAIGNVKNYTRIYGNRKGDHLTRLQLPLVEQDAMNYDPIYMGEINITVESSKSNDFLVKFKNLHMSLKVNIIGIEQVNYKMEEMSLNLYDYPSNYIAAENFINSFRSFKVPLKPSEDNDIAYTDTLNVLRGEQQLPLSIELLRRERRVEKFLLSDILKRVSSINLLQQEVYIPIDIVLKPLGIDIKIQDWIIEDYDPQFN